MANGHGGARPGTGRKKGEVTQAKLTLIEKAKGFADDALQVLVDIAQSVEAPPASRVSAAVAILDRGYGKPVQATEVSGKDGKPIQTEEVGTASLTLKALINGIAERRGTTGEPETN